jgi:hypothetical protein
MLPPACFCTTKTQHGHGDSADTLANGPKVAILSSFKETSCGFRRERNRSLSHRRLGQAAVGDE